MITLTPNEAILLHRLLTDEAGTADGIRDMGLLESAIYSQNAAFGGVELYPSLIEKASRLFYALVSNHAFADGNKRIGLLAYLTTLAINDVTLSATDDELITLTLSLADGSIGYDEVLLFTRAHIA